MNTLGWFVMLVAKLLITRTVLISSHKPVDIRICPDGYAHDKLFFLIALYIPVNQDRLQEKRSGVITSVSFCNLMFSSTVSGYLFGVIKLFINFR